MCDNTLSFMKVDAVHYDYCILTNLTLVNEVLHPDNAKQHFLGLSKHINRASLQNNKRNNTQIKRFKNTYN